jgi:heme-degrading monooxygenase HmoA
MSVVIVNEIEGGSEELYEQVNPKVMPDGNLPDGCQLHIAGPVENGWRVITVWESEDRFQQFREEKLIPAMQEAAEGDRIAPQISADPVHRLLIA